MAFNEPEMSPNVGGSALSMAEAVDGYRRLMQPFAGRVSLGAPQTTYLGGWTCKIFSHRCDSHTNMA